MVEAQITESDRKTYYVAVGARQILEDKEAAAFEFAIEANESELAKLEEMFDEINGEDIASAIRHLDLESSSDWDNNTWFNDQLKEIYAFMYELGTDETKQFIQSMGIL